MIAAACATSKYCTPSPKQPPIAAAVTRTWLSGRPSTSATCGRVWYAPCAPEQHAGDADVLDVDAGAGDDAGDVDARDARADHGVLRYRLRRRLPGRDAAAERPARGRRVHVPARRHLDVEELAAEQLPVGDGLAASGDDT